MDVLAGRAGDDSGLAAEDAWLGMLEGWTERLAPRRGGEVVAVALSETVSCAGLRKRLQGKRDKSGI